MKNEWVSMKNPMAAWRVVFNPVVDSNSIEMLFRYSSELLAIAQEEKVFQIRQSRLGVLGAPSLPYLEQLRWVVEHKKMFPFFGHLGGTSEQNGFVAEKSTQIAYYDPNGKVIEEEIADLGSLLERLNPNLGEISKRQFARHRSPVEIVGAINVVVDSQMPSRPDFGISLHSDIWFPKIIGYQRDSHTDLLDNSELASIHTPRLNRFLKSARLLTLEYGASWSVMKPEFYPDYQEMVLEDGIQLEIET